MTLCVLPLAGSAVCLLGPPIWEWRKPGVWNSGRGTVAKSSRAGSLRLKEKLSLPSWFSQVRARWPHSHCDTTFTELPKHCPGCLPGPPTPLPGREEAWSARAPVGSEPPPIHPVPHPSVPHPQSHLPACSLACEAFAIELSFTGSEARASSLLAR